MILRLIVWILKGLLLMQIIQFGVLFYKSKKMDNTLIPSFGILACIEISVAMGMDIATSFSIYDISYGGVVLFIACIANIYTYIVINRIIIAGKKVVILKRESVPIHTLIGMKTNLYSVIFCTKAKNFKIIYPIIRYDSLENQLYRKVNRI